MARSAGELGLLGAPLAGVYGLGVRLRRTAYDRRWLSVWTPLAQTISVGGIEAGGSGKTPVAAWMLELLRRDGRTPGLVTRGYRRQASGLEVRATGETPRWELIGDEPAMVVASGLDVPVAACADRRIGARALLDQHGCDALVLDDAFSHRAIGRHLDLVVLRGEAPVGRGRLLPWGTLREPVSSLERADVLWFHLRGEPTGVDPAWLRYGRPEALRVVSRAEALPAVALGGAPFDITGARVLAAAGIARPEDFTDSLWRLGAEVLESIAFGDHHVFSEQEVDRLLARARQLGADGVVVTPKDAVKVARCTNGGALWVVGTRVRVLEGAARLAERLGITSAALAQPPLVPTDKIS